MQYFTLKHLAFIRAIFRREAPCLQYFTALINFHVKALIIIRHEYNKEIAILTIFHVKALGFYLRNF